jgi:hypothetical protein
MKRGLLTSMVRGKRRVRGRVDVSPTDVQEIMDHLGEAGQHLSHLASTTFQLEKARVMGWIHGKVAESLKALTGEQSQFAEFWR